MQCERAQEFFSDYLERTLDRPMTVALEAHLASCTACREELEGLRETMLALDSLPPVAPPPDGAWLVMCRLRQLRVAELEAARNRAPSLLERLRAWNPLSVAMGAALATLIVVGTVSVTGVPHVQWRFFGGPARPAPAAVPEAPTLIVAYGAPTPNALPVSLQLVPSVTLRDAQVVVSGESLDQNRIASGTMPRGMAVPFQLMFPLGSRAEVLRVRVSSPSLRRREYHYLVVLPIVPAGTDRATLTLAYQPLDDALGQLAPYLGKPVIVEETVDGAVSLQVEDRPAARCLEELAAQVQATVRLDGDVYRLAPAAPNP